MPVPGLAETQREKKRGSDPTVDPCRMGQAAPRTGAGLDEWSCIRPMHCALLPNGLEVLQRRDRLTQLHDFF